MYPQDHPTHWYQGQGLWEHIPAHQWNSWAWQLQNRITKLEQLESFLELTPQERQGCLLANQRLAFAITPYFFNLIDRTDPTCPIRRQVIPNEAELHSTSGETTDPVGEEKNLVAPGLVHRYPDRVLFLVTDRCAAYCRYCTRSRLVSNAQDYNFHPEFEKSLEYIRQHPEVRDVLLSGGDPLLLSDSKLAYLLWRLRDIPHVEFIRIGSRIPVFLPQRITEELCTLFKQIGPVWMSIHVNHPKECTAALKEACDKLAFAGVPLGNQSVLLKGINDTPAIMKSLVHRLLQMRVRPYYLYQCDLIKGSAHLRTDVRKGVELIQALRSHTTGYAIPQFVVDAPGGGGKIPLNPNYLHAQDDHQLVLRNYKDELYSYPF